METERIEMNPKFGKRRFIALAGAAIAALMASASYAQRPADLSQIGQVRMNTPINAAKDISFNQMLKAYLPLDTTFTDESGAVVPLKNYFGKKPVILMMPFYRCPGICTQELNGLTELMKDERFPYRVGRDFEAIIISINPKESPDLATAKKKEYLDALNQPGAESGWRFLTGNQANIKKIADTIGYKFVYDPKTDQYAHAAGFVILTPEGEVSRYFFGVGYDPRDAKLALTEAGKGKVGTVIDQFILACYHYDPATGTYGPKVFALLQIAGFATVGLLGAFIFFALRADIKQPKLIKLPDGRIVPEGQPLQMPEGKA